MSRKKTAEALAKTLNKSGDTVLRILKDECIDANELICKAQQYFGDNKVDIIIDDTIINKMYSKYIEGTGDIYDPVSKNTFRSLCSVVAMISDGTIALPVLHTLWIKEELSSPGQYKTKVEIAKELIDKLKEKLKIKIVLMDGLYASSKMITWCNERSINFEMRFHSNRKIALNKEKLNNTIRMNECEKLQLRGKKSCRTVQAFWHGELVYVTCVKRLNKNNSTIITYQISNIAMLPRNHVNAYNKRWAIEKFFRTGKQHLGLADCQSRKKTLQEKHIYNVFLAYMILQFERKNKKFKNPERALYHIKQKKNIPITVHLERANQIFRSIEAIHA